MLMTANQCRINYFWPRNQIQVLIMDAVHVLMRNYFQIMTSAVTQRLRQMGD